MANQKLRVNWRCIHCQKRNIEAFGFQFDAPKRYGVTWKCSKCGNETEIIFLLTTGFPAPKDNK